MHISKMLIQWIRVCWQLSSYDIRSGNIHRLTALLIDVSRFDKNKKKPFKWPFPWPPVLWNVHKNKSNVLTNIFIRYITDNKYDLSPCLLPFAYRCTRDDRGFLCLFRSSKTIIVSIHDAYVHVSIREPRKQSIDFWREKL